MDTSPKYINMCRKARELQEMWKPSLGDHVYKNETEKTVVLGNVLLIESSMCYPRYRYVDGTLDRNDTVWLPRIDQQITLSGLVWNQFLFNIVESNIIDSSAEATGMRELMKMLYGKKWNGEDWI